MKKILPFVVALAMGAFLSACDNPISMRTVVHEDGSLDKNITLLKTDSARALRNPFGISASSGWHVVTERLRDSSESKPRYRISFDKHFDHVDAMNTELDTRADTLFQIHSNLDIRFRWFYTYMTYRETIRPVNRFKGVPASDFFTREDSLFVERLPAEGKRITRADSLQLDMLNEKISERFVNRALFQESYDILAAVVKRNAEQRWLDTLAK
ncbi:MAG: hypothetical protein K1X47_17995 [Cyclobacteriaceae bacterium]|nr:hypothetical protein [Cyclobacteriaceae bacterium]